MGEVIVKVLRFELFSIAFVLEPKHFVIATCTLNQKIQEQRSDDQTDSLMDGRTGLR